MLPTPCVIIDDLEASLSALSDVGYRIVAPLAAAIREDVCRFADRRGWSVLSHARFRRWLNELGNIRDTTVVSLDPLLCEPERTPPMLRLRMGRKTSLARPDLLSEPDWATEGEPRFHAAIVDDVAVTGGTLIGAAMLLQRAQSHPIGFCVAAASRYAEERVRKAYPRAQWHVMLRGDWKVCHMRDGCPYVPWSSHRTMLAPVQLDDGSIIEIRKDTASVDGNLWQVLLLDSHIARSVQEARSRIPELLANHLGRRATVGDLAALGKHVSATVTTKHQSPIHAATCLPLS